MHHNATPSETDNLTERLQSLRARLNECLQKYCQDSDANAPKIRITAAIARIDKSLATLNALAKTEPSPAPVTPPARYAQLEGKILDGSTTAHELSEFNDFLFSKIAATL